jgi:hypothetical protein
MTSLIKSGAYITQSRIISAIAHPQFMKNSLFVHLVFRWVMAVFARDLSAKMLTEIYTAAETVWFSRPAHSIRLHVIQRKIISASNAGAKQSRRELAMINEYCISQVKAGFVTIGLIEVFVALSIKSKDHQPFFRAVGDWVASLSGAAAIPIAQAIALHHLSYGSDAGAAQLQMRYFYVLFNCIIVRGKQNRALGHAEWTAKYTGVYRRALELLNDPRLRVFAPVLAMFADDVPVPAEVEAFFQQNVDRIERFYTLDSAHEW